MMDSCPKKKTRTRNIKVSRVLFYVLMSWSLIFLQIPSYFPSCFSCIYLQRERWQKPVLRRLQVKWCVLFPWIRTIWYLRSMLNLVLILTNVCFLLFIFQPPPPVNDTNPYNVFRPREKAHRLHTRRVSCFVGF